MFKKSIKGFLSLVCLIVIFFFGMIKGYNLAVESARLETVENSSYTISYEDFHGARQIYDYNGDVE